jgi:hypothetical protein
MKAFVSAGKLALAASQSLAAAVGHARVTAFTRALNAASERAIPVWTQHTPPPAARVQLLPIWTPDTSSAPMMQSSSSSSSASSSSPEPSSMRNAHQSVAVFESCVVNMMGAPPPSLEGSGSDVRLATRRLRVQGYVLESWQSRVYCLCCVLLPIFIFHRHADAVSQRAAQIRFLTRAHAMRRRYMPP